ncbi:lipase secretion chaperone [Pseudomonas sp.]|uniref:lipase secretion chaperone n=1 Tax=Pseudomonas sp. TaxID=306 RepID=UPI00272D0663|nr:lipase secretion chaperone [Pseudomonas sp.]
MKVLLYSAALALILTAGWQLSGREPAESATTNAQPTGHETPRPNLISLTRPAPGSQHAVAADSLRGTEVDGQLMVDERGALVLDEQLRHLFDYFYTTVGEVSFDAATETIREHLRASLPQPALDQALNLLLRYIDYKTALADLEREFPVVADLEGLQAREEAVQRLRASLFSIEAHRAFFGAEEVYNLFTLQRLAIVNDDQLSATDKAERIEALRNDLPGEMQALLVPQLHHQLSDETAALLASGGDAHALRELRMSIVGPEATERLEALDRERARWQQRLDAFQAERQAILDFPGLAESDKQAAIDELLHDSFAPSEQLRIAALTASQ